MSHQSDKKSKQSDVNFFANKSFLLPAVLGSTSARIDFNAGMQNLKLVWLAVLSIQLCNSIASKALPNFGYKLHANHCHHLIFEKNFVEGTILTANQESCIQWANSQHRGLKLCLIHLIKYIIRSTYY